MASQVRKYLGIDVGGGSLKAALIDKKGKIYQESKRPTVPSWSNSEFLEALSSLVEDFPLSEFETIGIGTPGPIDISAGKILLSANLKNLYDVPLTDTLFSRFSKKIYFNNDANCAALGEYHFGLGKNLTNLIVITLGTGYGCGWILDGEIFNGYNGNGMEAGHQTVVVNGAICGCGNRGCVEAYFSTKGLLTRFQERTNLELKDALSFFRLIEKNDEDAKDILGFSILALAHSLKNIIHTVNPQKIVLVGGITKSKDLFFPRLLENIKEITFPVLQNYTKIEIGNGFAGTLGAAALCFERSDDE